MMIMPRRDDFDLLDDFFREPFFKPHRNEMMKTDIKENDDNYSIEIDLPGYEKENIKIDIDGGYLTINAIRNYNQEEKETEKFVRRERYFGECSRSFYVGDNVEVEDVKATFKNGTLKLDIPKKEKTEELSEKKYVQIDE